MVEKIKDLKDEMLMQAEQDMHEGGNVDPKTIDSIKDLAEAEKACWEAEYYRAVTEAMEDGQMGYDDGMGYESGGNMGYARGDRGGSGYARGGQGGSGYEQGGYGYERGRGYRRGYERGGQGYEQGGRGYRRGYRGQPRDSQGRYASRRGYRRMENYGHQDMIDEVRQMMETADPKEREQLKMQLRQMTEQM